MSSEISHGSWEQLNEYAHNIRTDDIYDSNEFDEDKVQFMQIVQKMEQAGVRKVGAMYPDDEHNEYGKFKENISITKIIEKPGENLENIDKFLEDSIKDILSQYSHVIKK